MANPNIFSAYLQAPRSVSDYMADMDRQDMGRMQLENARGQNALLALTRQQQADAAQSAIEDRNALQQLAPQAGGDTNKLISLLRSTGRPGLLSQADALEKGYLERQKTEAEVGEKKANTTKAQGAVLDDTLKRYRGHLDFVDTPDAAVRWVQAQYTDPVLGPHVQRLGSVEQALSGIPSDPAAFQQWRQQEALGMDKFLEQQQKGKDYQLKANNELIGPDGKPNQALIGAKQSIAKAGASNVSVNTGQKGIENELKMRDDFRSEPVYKAFNEVKSAYSQIQQGLKLQSPAGDLAAATKIMKMLDPGSVVRESELGMAMAATGLMDRISGYATNILKGTKLTPQQRADFQNLADALYQESEKQYGAKGAEYEDFAKQWGLNGPRITGRKPVQPSATGANAGANRVVNFSDLK